MATMERYYIKTRGLKLSKEDADKYGIRRVYNYTSDMEFMGYVDQKMWSEGLKRKGSIESVLVESAMKSVGEGTLYVSTCIIFHTIEMANIFFITNSKGYGKSQGFLHLMN
jgi:N-acetylglutamate synthase-like GNAT family acetyltransferase